MIKIAPSLLAADWGHVATEVKDVVSAGADWMHIDVMDGSFVPPITIGPQMVEAVKKVCDLPLDVHLMIESPERQLESFRRAGADIITVHYETCPHLHRTVQAIHELGAKAGCALNPATPIAVLESIVSDLDLILVMTVNPGWGGQAFIESSVNRIAAARELIASTGKKIWLQVDGGINETTAMTAVSAGADVLVAGSYIYGHPPYKERIDKLRKAG